MYLIIFSGRPHAKCPVDNVVFKCSTEVTIPLQTAKVIFKSIDLGQSVLLSV